MELPERMIDVSGVELCSETFGDLADPPILLVMGIGGSMLSWEEGFCGMLADGGRFVIRYDHRDTGRSVTYEPEHPEYTGADLVADAVGVLDAYDIEAARFSRTPLAELRDDFLAAGHSRDRGARLDHGRCG